MQFHPDDIKYGTGLGRTFLDLSFHWVVIWYMNFTASPMNAWICRVLFDHTLPRCSDRNVTVRHGPRKFPRIQLSDVAGF